MDITEPVNESGQHNGKEDSWTKSRRRDRETVNDSGQHSGKEDSWTTSRRRDRGRNPWQTSTVPKRKDNSHAWGSSAVHKPPPLEPHGGLNQQESTKQTPGWATIATNRRKPNKQAADSAPVDMDLIGSVIPAPQEEWVVEDEDALSKLTSLNLAARCYPVYDWNTKAKGPQEYHQMIKKQNIEKWVMEGTEEEEPLNMNFKGIRQLWKPFSNVSHTLPGAYS